MSIRGTKKAVMYASGMATVPDFRAEVRSLLRDRLLDATRELTCNNGWDAVTMSGVAAAVGVSRQSVYREFGGKTALGQVMIEREADWFLTQVRAQLDTHADDLAAELAAAAETTLHTGAGNPLIKAILAASHGVNDDLLPLLTTRPEPVLQRAIAAILDQIRTHGSDLGEAELTRLVEVVVRLTLSHLFQPTSPTEHAIEQIHWIITSALTAAAAR